MQPNPSSPTERFNQIRSAAQAYVDNHNREHPSAILMPPLEDSPITFTVDLVQGYAIMRVKFVNNGDEGIAASFVRPDGEEEIISRDVRELSTVLALLNPLVVKVESGKI
jgi:hypothetical protein